MTGLFQFVNEFHFFPKVFQKQAENVRELKSRDKYKAFLAFFLQRAENMEKGFRGYGSRTARVVPPSASATG